MRPAGDKTPVNVANHDTHRQLPLAIPAYPRYGRANGGQSDER
ncbi:hypothetical protein SAMN04488092_11631 [Thalassovita taeanensis]|uniref:Uncharacterized protein n=1 Tax=Thalassovita taeanensis TaxID=657014 RepID=A0A1H9JUB1_9RHOB|nr:hypothetical protein SAMN04488092_11631 [Thalassovita taeanensis]